MSLTLDLIIIIVFIVCILLGIKRGFVKSAAKFIGTVFSVLAASLIGEAVAGWIYQSFVRDPFVEMIGNVISGLTGSESISGVFSTLPDFIVRALTEAGFTEENLLSRLTSSQGEAAEVIVDAISPVFIAFIKTFAFIVLFLLFMIIVSAVARIIDRMINFTLLSSVNRILGGVFGILIALIVIWVAFAITGVFIPLATVEMQSAFNEAKNTSWLAKAFMDANPFSGIFR